MTAAIDKILQDMTRRLVAEFQPTQIFLFGSHAWGQPTEDSDMDLLVIVPSSEISPRERRLQARRCLRDLSTPRDILVETQAEVERANCIYTTLESEILDRGVRLYG